MLANLRHLLQRDRFHWASCLVLLLVVGWIWGLCAMPMASSEPGQYSHVMTSQEPAGPMSMSAASGEMDCCVSVSANTHGVNLQCASASCGYAVDLLAKVFEHSFVAVLFVVIALLAVFFVRPQSCYSVRHQRWFSPPPLYLLNCVFRH